MKSKACSLFLLYMVITTVLLVIQRYQLRQSHAREERLANALWYWHVENNDPNP